MIRLRPATIDDVAAMLAIYAPIVRESAISFELEPPSAEEFARRVEAAHLWLVAEREGGLLGYAYGGTFRARAAYRWSVETSVYVAADARGRGVGRRLMTGLLAGLRLMGYQQALAGTTLPNDASVALHRALGFEPVGIFRAVGHKFGAWHDVGWYALSLAALPIPAPEPRRREEIDPSAWQSALNEEDPAPHSPA